MGSVDTSLHFLTALICSLSSYVPRACCGPGPVLQADDTAMNRASALGQVSRQMSAMAERSVQLIIQIAEMLV